MVISKNIAKFCNIAIGAISIYLLLYGAYFTIAKIILLCKLPKKENNRHLILLTIRIQWTYSRKYMIAQTELP